MSLHKPQLLKPSLVQTGCNVTWAPLLGCVTLIENLPTLVKMYNRLQSHKCPSHFLRVGPDGVADNRQMTDVLVSMKSES